MSTRAKVIAALACMCMAAAFGQELSQLNFLCGTTRPFDTETPSPLRSKGFGYATVGVKSVLVIRVDFTNAPGATLSEEHATNVLAAVDAFYRTTSFRQLSLPTVVVTPVLRLAGDAREFGGRPHQIAAEARAAAEAAGFSFNAHDFVIYTFPPIGFPYSGYGMVGGKGIWIPGIDFVPQIVAHEIGHNLGLEHACSWTTTDDSLIGPGTAWDYGNSYDAMGNSPYFPSSGFNGNYRYLLGWLTESDVHTAYTNGTYRVHTMDGEDTLDWEKRYSLRIPAAAQINGLACDYWLDYRGSFTYEHTRNGLLVQAATPTSRQWGNLLLDMTPATSGQSDAPLILGQTFEDRIRGIFVTPVSVDTKNRRHIDVVVTRNTSGNRPPVLEFNLPVQMVGAGEKIALLAQTSDPDLDQLAYTWDFGDGTLPSPLNNREVIKSWAQPGIYPVHCTVSDMKGGVVRQTRIIRVGNPVRFHISGRVTAAGAPISGARVSTIVGNRDKRDCVTDDNGFYLLPNAGDGTNTVTAIKAGFKFSPRSIVPDATTTNVNFAAILPPPIPVITSFTPASARPGEIITIAGTNFLETAEVRLGNIYAAFGILSVTQIVAVVPRGIATGTIFVTTPAGIAASSSAFVVDGTSGDTVLPFIERFEPLQASTGSLVRIFGRNLSSATAVRMGSRAVAFYSLSATELVVLLPADALTASFVVTTSQGTAVSASPLLVVPGDSSTNITPSVVAFSPTFGVLGEVVRILGQNLGAASAVFFGAETASFTTVSSHELRAVVPSNARSTNLFVVTPNGIAPSRDYFFVDIPRPLTISGHPQGGSTGEGQNWSFAIDVLGSGPLRYQWRKNGANIPATNATLLLTNVTAADSGMYDVEVRNSVSTLTSQGATLQVLRLSDAVQQAELIWRTSPDAPWSPQSRFTLDDPLAAESAGGPHASWIESAVEGPVRLTFWWQLSAQRFDDALEFSIDSTNQARITGSVGWTKHTVELEAGTHVLRWTRRGSPDSLGRLTQVTIERVWFRQQPISRIALAGEPVTLAAAVSGAADLQWLHNGIAMPGATNAELSFSAVQPAHEGDYVLVFSNASATAASVVARLTVAPAFISLHPQSTTKVATSNVTLSVEFQALAPTAIQWFFNSNALSQATNRSLTFQALPDAAGHYHALLANPFGAVTSAVASVAVIAEAPAITNASVSDYLAFRGENVLLSSTATGAPPPSFIWTRNGRSIRGANGASLSLPSIRSTQKGTYTAIAQNPFGVVTQQFRVTVQQCAILEHPGSQQVWAGDTLTLSVLAKSASPIRYQWQRGGITIPGATNATLVIPNARVDDSGSYDVLIRSRVKRLRSLVADVSVRGQAPVFVYQPESHTGDAGTPVDLYCQVDAHPAASFRWYFEGEPVPNAQLPWLAIPLLTTNREGAYVVVASNEFGSVTSAPALVNIALKIPEPRISPRDFETVEGNFILLRSTRAFSPAATQLQWLLNGNPLPAANGEMHLLPSVSPGDAGKYRLLARNPLGEGVSSGTDIYVSPPRRLDMWQRRGAAPRSEDILSLAYGNGTFVAGGESGTLLTSSNGSHWRDLSLQTTCAVASVAFVGGSFLALVEENERGGALIISSNAQDWRMVPLAAPLGFRSVSAAHGRFIVSAEGWQSNLIVAVSQDGKNWTETHFSIPAATLSVAAGGDRFVAAGAANIVFSDYATTWNLGPPLPAIAVAYGNGTFTAVGAGGRVWTSPNGTEWTSRSSGTTKDLTCILFSSSGFSAFGEDGAAITSLDGTVWKPMNSETTFELATAAADGGRVVAAGEAGCLLRYESGILEGRNDRASHTTLGGIAVTNGLLVTVGNGGLIRTSSDGKTWTTRPSPTGKDLLSIAPGPAGFVAAGEDGRIITSSNGLSWRAVTPPATNHITRITFAQDRYYAVGDTGILLESTNGVNWVARRIPMPGTDATLGGVAINRGLHVAAGGYHDEKGFARTFVAVSANGVDWTQLDITFGVKLRSIISYGDGFVAIGNDGLVAISTDGFRWRHQRLAGEGDNLRAITTLPDGMLVAVGNRGVVFSSANGIEWLRHRLFTSKNLHDITLAGNDLIAVATDGAIFTSELVLPTLALRRPSPTNAMTLEIDLGARDQYRLQESFDLHLWNDVETFIHGKSPKAYRAPITGATEQRFYRLQWP